MFILVTSTQKTLLLYFIQNYKTYRLEKVKEKEI